MLAVGAHSPNEPFTRTFATVARGWSEGRVVEIDYKRSQGRAELVDLIASADVFLHNWRPGRAESLGLYWDRYALRGFGSFATLNAYFLGRWRAGEPKAADDAAEAHWIPVAESSGCRRQRHLAVRGALPRVGGARRGAVAIGISRRGGRRHE